jgi:micrococcal nuclease
MPRRNISDWWKIIKSRFTKSSKPIIKVSVIKNKGNIYSWLISMSMSNPTPELNVDISERLAISSWKNTNLFIPALTYGKVIKVYDGDTLTVAAPLYNGSTSTILDIYRFNIRLRGIDAPEIKSSGSVEKMLAIKSRDALSGIVMNKTVILRNIETEKYGRLLCDVYIDDVNVCEWMVEHKYAVLYEGKHKMRPAEWSE